jgi:hypothetical protein
MKRIFATLAITAGAAACTLTALVPGTASAAPQPQAHAAPAARCGEFDFECPVYFSNGQKLWVLYGNSPLRGCASTSCAPITYMPATTSLNPGGGWVTSEAYQNADNPWCLINYRSTEAWTGCWRLSS